MGPKKESKEMCSADQANYTLRSPASLPAYSVPTVGMRAEEFKNSLAPDVLMVFLCRKIGGYL